MEGFVGRRGQLSRLGAAFDRARSGRGGLVLVFGEPGIGKTRLCRELAETARAAQATVAWAYCQEADSAPALWPWEQVLRRLTGEPMGDPDDTLKTSDAGTNRARFFDAIVDEIAAATVAGPIVVVVDDLHWADEASVALLAHLAKRLPELPALVVATVRDVEGGPGTAVGDALGALGGHAEEIRLFGLEPSEMPNLIRSVTDSAPGSRAATALHHHTHGNPLFARELVRLLDAQGLLDGLTADQVPAVPGTVWAVLAGRLRRLSPECTKLLETASVVGDSFGLDVLAAVLATNRERLLELVDEAVRLDVLTETSVGSYRFSHPLVRATILESLGVASRVRLNERVGLALEELMGSGYEVRPASLAHHFLNAAAAGGAAKAAGYAVESARRAMARMAYESAARDYTSALRALDLDPSGADRFEVLMGLGEARGAGGRPGPARECFFAAAELARAARRPDRLARAALGAGGGGFEVALADREQIDLLEEALQGLGSGQDLGLQARVAARLSVALSLSGAEDRRLALSDQALQLARQAGDPDALAYALSAHCDSIAGPADVERRLAEAAEIVALATGMGDRATEMLGRRMRLVALLELGDMAGAGAEIEAYARLADVVCQPLYSWYVPLWRGMQAFVRGDLSACELRVAEASALGTSAGSENAVLLSEGLRWCCAREGADFESPLSELEALMAYEPVLGAQMRVVASLILADAGRTDEARARLDASAAAIQALPQDSEWVPVLGQLAQAVALVGGHPLAQWAYDSLLPHRRLFGVEGIAAAWWGSVERPLGLLAATLGRVEEAAGHFDAAVAANRAAGSPLFVARTLLDAGLALGDRSRLELALAAYRQLGIGRRVEQVESLLAETSTPNTDTVPQEANVFRREGEVWALGFGGRVVRAKDVKGMADLARLLSRPGQELAAVELVAAPGALVQGHSGDLIDDQARDEYKARLDQLERELEDADAAGDSPRSRRAHEERDAIVAQLSAAYGLGGRKRRTGGDGERARQAATWRIRDALTRIESVHPELGRHLRRSVRTGSYCVYDPPEPTSWST